MSDLFGESAGNTQEEAGPPGPESSYGADLPAASTTAITTARQQAIALAVNPDYRIATPDEARSAGEVLGKIKGLLGRMDEERKARLAPLNEQIRTINCEYTDPNGLLWEIEKKIKGELLVFRKAEENRLEEQRRIELKVAEQERARLEEQARRDRETAAAQAARLRQRGKDEKADSLLRQAEASAQAKERTAALVSAPTQPTAPTKVAGVSVRTRWLGKVTDARRFLRALSDSPYDPAEIVEFKQIGMNKLASSLKDNMDSVLPGSIAWADDGIAARSK